MFPNNRVFNYTLYPRHRLNMKQSHKKASSPYFFPRILNIFVSHFAQAPVMARRSCPPLPFMATSFASFISRFSRHFTQYPSFMDPYYHNKEINTNPLIQEIGAL